MKIINEHNETIIDYVGKAIAKDAMSWNGWRLAHVEVRHPENENDSIYPLRMIQDALREHFKQGDGVVMFCKDGDVLVLAREIAEDHLLWLTKEMEMLFGQTAYSPVRLNVYDLGDRWREVVELFALKKASNLSVLVEDNYTLAPSHSDESLQAEIEELDDICQRIMQYNFKMRGLQNPACVLLVEDDQLTRRLASNVLKNDYRLVTAANAEEAVLAYLLHSPDIVFLDINLPDHNGFSVLKSLMKCDNNAYIVMFSCNGYSDNVIDALNIGAKGFITKPFHKELFWHYIRDCEYQRRMSSK
ncbi:MAG: response regulator [Alphaproteobacteria bacterium]|nr:response regulator [Alphaproteobacteria bacterium]